MSGTMMTAFGEPCPLVLGACRSLIAAQAQPLSKLLQRLEKLATREEILAAVAHLAQRRELSLTMTATTPRGMTGRQLDIFVRGGAGALPCSLGATLDTLTFVLATGERPRKCAADITDLLHDLEREGEERRLSRLVQILSLFPAQAVRASVGQHVEAGVLLAEFNGGDVLLTAAPTLPKRGVTADVNVGAPAA